MMRFVSATRETADLSRALDEACGVGGPQVRSQVHH